MAFEEATGEVLKESKKNVTGNWRTGSGRNLSDTLTCSYMESRKCTNELDYLIKVISRNSVDCAT